MTGGRIAAIVTLPLGILTGIIGAVSLVQRKAEDAQGAEASGEAAAEPTHA